MPHSSTKHITPKRIKEAPKIRIKTFRRFGLDTLDFLSPALLVTSFLCFSSSAYHALKKFSQNFLLIQLFIQGGILSDRKCEFIEIFLEKILDLKLLWSVEVDGSCIGTYLFLKFGPRFDLDLMFHRHTNWVRKWKYILI